MRLRRVLRQRNYDWVIRAVPHLHKMGIKTDLSNREVKAVLSNRRKRRTYKKGLEGVE